MAIIGIAALNPINRSMWGSGIPQQTKLVSPAATVDFSGLTGDFFRIHGQLPAGIVNAQAISMRFNGDTGTNYCSQMGRTSGTNNTAVRPAQTDEGLITDNVISTTLSGAFVVHVAKPFAGQQGQWLSHAGDATPNQWMHAGIWANTSAKITSIQLRGDAGTNVFETNSSFLLEQAVL